MPPISFAFNCRAAILAAGFEIGGEDRRLQFSYLINMDFSSVIARGCEETPRIALTLTLSPREREDRAEDGLLSDL
jgi:hypothetical protein